MSRRSPVSESSPSRGRFTLKADGWPTRATRPLRSLGFSATTGCNETVTGRTPDSRLERPLGTSGCFRNRPLCAGRNYVQVVELGWRSGRRGAGCGELGTYGYVIPSSSGLVSRPSLPCNRRSMRVVIPSSSGLVSRQRCGWTFRHGCVVIPSSSGLVSRHPGPKSMTKPARRNPLFIGARVASDRQRTDARGQSRNPLFIGAHVASQIHGCIPLDRVVIPSSSGLMSRHGIPRRLLQPVVVIPSSSGLMSRPIRQTNQA